MKDFLRILISLCLTQVQCTSTRRFDHLRNTSALIVTIIGDSTAGKLSDAFMDLMNCVPGVSEVAGRMRVPDKRYFSRNGMQPLPLNSILIK